MVDTTSGSNVTQTPAPDPAEQTLRTARECIDALSQGDRARLQSTLAPDAVWHSAASGETFEGSEAITRNLFGYRNTFPDLNEEITNAFASADQALLETLVTGTYGGAALSNLPGSGRHISLPLCYIFRVEGGKIVKITTYMDYRTMMAQLDMILT